MPSPSPSSSPSSLPPCFIHSSLPPLPRSWWCAPGPASPWAPPPPPPAPCPAPSTSTRPGHPLARVGAAARPLHTRAFTQRPPHLEPQKLAASCWNPTQLPFDLPLPCRRQLCDHDHRVGQHHAAHLRPGRMAHRPLRGPRLQLRRQGPIRGSRGGGHPPRPLLLARHHLIGGGGRNRGLGRRHRRRHHSVWGPLPGYLCSARWDFIHGGVGRGAGRVRSRCGGGGGPSSCWWKWLRAPAASERQNTHAVLRAPSSITGMRGAGRRLSTARLGPGRGPAVRLTLERAASGPPRLQCFCA